MQYQAEIDIARAELLLIEKYAFWFSLGWAMAAYLKWDSWLISVVVLVVMLYLSDRGHKEKFNKAVDRYENRPILSDED